MHAVYTVEQLRAEKVDQAYPLIQAVEPRLTLDQWRRSYETNTSDDGRAVLVAWGATGYLYSVCVVEAVRPPKDAPFLAVSKLVIDTALDAEGVASAMLRSFADFAARSGCTRVRISVMGTDEAALVALARARADLPQVSLTIEMR